MKFLSKFKRKGGNVRQLPAQLGYFLSESLQMSEDSLPPLKTHRFVLNLFDELLENNSQGCPLYFHRQGDGKKWRRYSDSMEYRIAVTAQMEFLADDKGWEDISEKHPLLPKITKALQYDGESMEAFLFQVSREYDYLLLFKREQEEAIFVKLFRLVVLSLQRQLETAGRNNVLEKKVNILKARLEGKEQKLQQTEKSLRKRVYEINNLLEISNELYSILDLEQLLNAALLIIIGQIGSEKAFVILHEPMQSGFYRHFSKGFGSEPTHITVDLDHPIVNYLTKKQQPIFVEDILKKEELETFAARLEKENIKILAPIIYSDRLEGLIACGEKLFGDQWGYSDIQMFGILVNIISVSLGNARMYENVKKMSFTDGMTNLNNYRYFDSRLREELKRARRRNSKVSLIMLDIDNFKNYNDSLGHQAGDEALRKLGFVLKNTAREDDIVNRYGGEEFTIILPGIEKKSISVLAERLRKTVEKEEFFREDVQPQGRLTISLGGATFPDDADDFEQLIAKADQALYYSKENGRNRFTLYNNSLE